jgi:hypothetical protein
MLKLVFTSGKSQPKTKPAPKIIKPLKKGSEYMGLNALKHSKGCKSCGH